MYIKMKKEVLSEILRLNSLISKQLITEQGGVVRQLVTKIVSELPKLSDEFATTFKSLNRQWANKEIDAIKYLDEVFSVAKGSPYEKELLDIITPIIGRNISENLDMFKQLIENKFKEQMDRDALIDLTMRLWDKHRNIGIEPIDDYIKQSLRKEIDELYGVVTPKITKIPESLSKIGKFLETWLPKNIRTIQTAYRKLFTDLDTIKKEMDDVVKEMVEERSKNQSADISAFVKRLQDLAASGVKKNNSTFKGVWNEMVKDNPVLKNNSSLRREILSESSKLENLMLDPKYNGGWGGLKLYYEAWGSLLNVKNLVKNPIQYGERLANFIIQATPYTSEEIAKRIRLHGVKNVLYRRAIGTSLSAFVVLPALSGVLIAILGAGAGAIDWVRMALGAEEEMFDLSKQNMKENFKEGFISMFPDSMWDVPILTTYIDDVWDAAEKGLEWKAKDSLTPEQLQAAEEGMRILKGEGSDLEGYEVQKTASVKREIKRLYPDIPTTDLAKIVVKSDNKAYYEQTTIADGVKLRRLSIVDGKVYINNDELNRRVEINKLWN
jgi:hypothetical protein